MPQKKIKLRIGQVVEVIWLDTIFHIEPSEEELSAHEGDGGVLVHTVGYLDKVSKKSVTIFSEKFSDGSGKGSYTIFAKAMIKKIIVLSS
jgi:hypothetical protein